MPRFYKTASANPLDYMHKLNTPLMERVIGANDDYITQNLQQAGQLENLATSFPFLKDDEGRANEIMSGYSKQIDDITKAIRDDPANWRKQLDPMRNVSRELQQNYKVGEISKIGANYTQYKKVADQIDKEVENYNKTGKGIDAGRGQKYKEYFLKKFSEKGGGKGTGYDAKTGKYNTMDVFDPMGNIDIPKVLSEGLEKMRADKSHYKRTEVTGEEWYLNDITNEYEAITPQKVLSIASDRLSNPQLMDYMRQDSMVGAMSGVFDGNGQLIAPYSYKGVPITPEEQKEIDAVKAQIAKAKDPNVKAQLEAGLAEHENGLKNRTQLEWNDKSSLSPMLRSIVNEHSYQNTKEESTLRNNSKKNTIYTQQQANARQKASLKQQKEIADAREKGINDRAAAALEEKKREWDNPHTKTGTGTKSATGTKKATEELPQASGVSQLATHSFEDWTTTDKNGQVVKVLSTDGLIADIDRLSKQQRDLTTQKSDLDKQMKGILGDRKPTDLNPTETALYNNLLVKKQDVEMQEPKVASDLNARRTWYKGSEEAALNSTSAALQDKDGDYGKPLTADELALYKKYEKDRDFKQTDAKLEQWKNRPKNQYDVNASQWESRIADFNALPEDDKKKRIRAGMENNKRIRDEEKQMITIRDKERDAYFDVKNKIEERKNNYLSSVRYSPIDTDAINLGKQDSEAISDMIKSNPTKVVLYDNNGHKVNEAVEGKGVSWWNPKGDNYNLTTEGVDKNVFDYMERYGAKMVVKKVGTTTKIGSGNAVAEVQFEDPKGQLPEGKTFYIELSPQLQKQIGTRMATDKDLGVNKIAKDLIDDEANDIRQQLITPTMQQTAGKSDGEDPVKTTIFISHGNKKIPLQVTKFVGSDGRSHISVTQSIDGVQTLLGQGDTSPNKMFTPPSGIAGWFNGPEDFIQYIKTQREIENQINNSKK